MQASKKKSEQSEQNIQTFFKQILSNLCTTNLQCLVTLNATFFVNRYFTHLLCMKSPKSNQLYNTATCIPTLQPQTIYIPNSKGSLRNQYLYDPPQLQVPTDSTKECQRYRVMQHLRLNKSLQSVWIVKYWPLDSGHTTDSDHVSYKSVIQYWNQIYSVLKKYLYSK